MSQLVVDVTRGDDVEIVSLEGELDYFVACELRQKLGKLGQSVVVDLSRLTFIDAGGVGALIGIRDELRASGARLELINPQPNVRRVFEITASIDLLAA